MPRMVPRLNPIVYPILWLAIVAGTARSQDFDVKRVATGVAEPVYLTAPPGDTTRTFILEQHTGRIRILRRNTWTLDATPFLTVTGVAQGNEQGLLGLAFHPDYATNGFFYVYLTDPASRVRRYHVSANPDVADAASGTPVLSISQPQAGFHNGGWMGFGIDRYLYVTIGDGGTSTNAQDTTSNRLGKVLRIDVDHDAFPADDAENWAAPPDNPFVGTTGDDEIWVYGLRNPWRASFDRQTGDFYIGDVGESSCEEIDVQPATSGGGENYGWPAVEGVIAAGGNPPPGSVKPFLDYPHSGSTCSNPPAAFAGVAVTGGFVYRGPAASLQGRYFFADYGTSRLWSTIWDGSSPATFDGHQYTSLTDHGSDPAFAPDAGTIGSIGAFGEDGDGNLYILDHGGEIFTVPEPAAAWPSIAGAFALLTLARRRYVRLSGR
jgi:glucose/arabinose dehydrogenase